MSNQYVLDILVNAGGNAADVLGKTTDKLAGFGNAAAGVAAGGVLLAATAMAGLGKAAFDVAREWDDAVDVLVTGTRASGDALDEMADSVVKLDGTSAGLNRTMSDIGAVMAEVNTRTGATGDQLEGFTKSVLDMTRLTGGDGVGAVQDITRVMGDWGVALDDSAGLMDKLFGAGQGFGISLESLTGKLVQFGAPLRQMGFSLDESIAMLGKWEKEGVNTELVIGSLRIAAGKFADEAANANAVLDNSGGIAKAQGNMEKYRQQLELATLRQSEFTEKTSESTKLSNQIKIQELTDKIAAEEQSIWGMTQAMEAAPAPAKSLSESLRETFDQIKNNTDGTAALAIAMDVFGARAGPDMAAAIREGRFELEDAMKVMEAAGGSIADTTARTMDFGDRWEITKTKVKNALLPIGQAMLDLGEIAMPSIERAADRVVIFLSEDLPAAAADLRTKWEEDWGGVRTTTEDTTKQLGIKFDEIVTKAKDLWDRTGEEFDRGQDDTLTGWEKFWADGAETTSGTLLNIADAVSYGLDTVSDLVDIWEDDTYTGWDGFWGKMGDTVDMFFRFLDSQFSLNLPDWFVSFMDAASGLGPNAAGGPIPLGYASGTPYAPGGLAYVHAGEMVAMPRGAQVYTANQTANMGGGLAEAKNVAINIYTNDAREAGRRVREELSVLELRRRRGG